NAATILCGVVWMAVTVAVGSGPGTALLSGPRAVTAPSCHWAAVRRAACLAPPCLPAPATANPRSRCLIMASIPTPPGVTSTRVPTSRLAQLVLSAGPEDGIPVLFVHGNASSATFWEDVMVALPPQYRAIAPDLRGYGDTDD